MILLLMQISMLFVNKNENAGRSVNIDANNFDPLEFITGSKNENVSLCN